MVAMQCTENQVRYLQRLSRSDRARLFNSIIRRMRAEDSWQPWGHDFRTLDITRPHVSSVLQTILAIERRLSGCNSTGQSNALRVLDAPQKTP
jgi:hypothetical protein